LKVSTTLSKQKEQKMLKCPVPGCEVKIAPKREGTTHLGQEKNSLVNHLTGIGKGLYVGTHGHGLPPDTAKKIARLVGEVSEEVDKALRARKSSKKSSK
jgi:hypothetical protein